MNYLQFKSELEIYVYEQKLKVYETFCIKYPQPKFDKNEKTNA